MNSKALTKLASASVLALSFGLAGCATKLNLEAPYDEMTFEKALPETDPPAPVQVVETPKVLPLPGQLKPIPAKGGKEEKLPPEQAIAKTERFTGLVTTVLKPPADAETLRKNPLGLYVHSLNWSRDLIGDAK